EVGQESLAGRHTEADRVSTVRRDRCDAKALAEFFCGRLIVGGSGGGSISMGGSEGKGDEVASHGALQSVRGVERYDLAMVDNRDAVAVLGLVHVVGCEEDGQALAGAKLGQVIPDALTRLRIEAQGWL